MPEDPARNGLYEANALQRVAFFFFTRLGLLLIGIWGVWRNLRPEYAPGEPLRDLEQGVLQPRPMPPASTATMPLVRRTLPRTSFGRRNA
jgi:hypothetical protein